eukprot:g660.t1
MKRRREARWNGRFSSLGDVYARPNANDEDPLPSGEASTGWQSRTKPVHMTRKQQTALANRLIGLDNDPTANNKFMIDVRRKARVPMPAHAYKGWDLHTMRDIRGARTLLAERHFGAIQSLGEELDELNEPSFKDVRPPPPPRKSPREQLLAMKHMMIGESCLNKERVRAQRVGEVRARAGTDAEASAALAPYPHAQFPLLPLARNGQRTFVDSTNASLHFTRRSGPRYRAAAVITAPRGRRSTRAGGEAGRGLPHNRRRRMRRVPKRDEDLFRGSAQQAPDTAY